MGHDSPHHNGHPRATHRAGPAFHHASAPRAGIAGVGLVATAIAAAVAACSPPAAALRSPVQTVSAPARADCGANAHATAGHAPAPVDADTGTTGSLAPPRAVPPTLHLAVGQSHIVRVWEMPCLVLAPGNERYVISAVNLSRAASVDALFTLQTRGSMSSEIARSHDRQVSMAAHQPTPGWASPPPLPLPEARAPVVPTSHTSHTSLASLSSADVGDDIALIDWEGRASQVRCGGSPSSQPHLRATVAVVAGNTVVMVDRRAANYDVFFTPQGRDKLQRAAARIDHLLLPTLRSLLRPDIDALVPMGANGRQFVIVTPLPPGYGGQAMPQHAAPGRMCPVSEGIAVGALSPDAATWTVGGIASIAIHELTHVFDFLAAVDAHRTSMGTRGWLAEAIASSAEETAARLALDQRTGARNEELTSDEPRPHWTSWLLPHAERESTWGSVAGDAGGGLPIGMYTTGSQILLYAREQMRHAAPDGAPLLYQRLLASHTGADRWSVDEVASAVGLAGDTLLDRAMLAIVTDDLVPPDSAAKYALPQIGAWTNRADVDARMRDERAADPSRVLERGAAMRETVRVGGGSYIYWDVPADTARGLWLVITPSAAPTQWILRVTRVR